MKVRSMVKTLKIRGMKALHFCVTVAMFILCWNLFFKARYTVIHSPKGDMVMYMAYAAFIFLLFRVYEVYNLGYASVTDLTFGQLLSNGIAAFATYVVSLLMYQRRTNAWPLLWMCGAQFVWDCLWSLAASRLYWKLHAYKRTVVVYRTPADLDRLQEISFLDKKFSIEKRIENPPDDFASLEKELEGFEAVVASGIDASLRNGIAKYCIERGMQGYFAPHVGDILMQGARHLRNFTVPIFNVRRAEPTPEYMLAKRVFDIFTSALALILFSPVMLLVALGVKLQDGGPILYRQVRLTKDGRRFHILKFRSMRQDAEGDGVARLASQRDDRVTPLGRFLRAYRLDELPQLINILRGDMSVVGPRPERPELAAEYEKEMPSFSLRLQVRAGLTGMAQVYGRYNSTPYDKLEMDLMYINKMSIAEDLRLVFVTVKSLLLQGGESGLAVFRKPKK